MKNSILKNIFLAFLGLLGFLFLLSSCGGNQTLAEVAEEDSLCIDTVASLDDVVLEPDTVAQADSLLLDSLYD